MKKGTHLLDQTTVYIEYIVNGSIPGPESDQQLSGMYCVVYTVLYSTRLFELSIGKVQANRPPPPPHSKTHGCPNNTIGDGRED